MVNTDRTGAISRPMYTTAFMDLCEGEGFNVGVRGFNVGGERGLLWGVRGSMWGVRGVQCGGLGGHTMLLLLTR